MFEVFQPLRIFSSLSGQELVGFTDRCLESGIADVVVNFQDVSFIDSAGLGALVTALKRLQAADGKLSLCSLNGQARMLLELTSMDQVFDIYSSLDDVKRKFAVKVGSEE